MAVPRNVSCHAVLAGFLLALAAFSFTTAQTSSPDTCLPAARPKSSAAQAAQAAVTDNRITKVYCSPSPFSLSENVYTTIRFTLNIDATLDIRIYTPEGELVWSTVKAMKSGDNEIQWTGVNDQGQKVVFGGYICHLLADPGGGGSRQTRTIKIGVIP